MTFFADIGWFIVFLFTSFTYGLVGAGLLALLALAGRRFLKTSLTATHWASALAICFVAGLYVQWRDVQHSVHIIDGAGATSSDVQRLNQRVHDLGDAVRERDETIQTLRREIDVLSAELDSDASEDLSIIAALRNQLDEHQRKISNLTRQLNATARP
ncbi:MAG TPA: hypothetical protein VJ746_16080 [Nitrospira sp.]|nr:hypothetical protein [Nitrospira sp.]